MKYYLTSSRLNMVLIGLLVLIGIGSFAYNQYLINQILEQERSSVELWARALEYTGNPSMDEVSRNLLGAANWLRSNDAAPDSLIDMIEEAESDRTTQNFVVREIILSPDRFQVPAVITNAQGEINASRNVDGEPDQELIEEFAETNPPIEISFGNEQYSVTQYVYYGESATVRYLRWFPYIQLSLLALLLGTAFISYRTMTRSEQSNLWVGMTKEAAHQLGTPLSSLYGWVELLREEKSDDEFTRNICDELENDITRLRDVADRFNKIGSEPELETRPIEPLIGELVSYMERRLPQRSSNIAVRKSIEANASVRVNPELLKWAVENLIKNAMDAIGSSQEEAFVSVRVHRIESELAIDVEDSGSGIEKKYHSEVFKPGYSTKKRGWGLGLSLTRRIIEEYHDGSIFILRSEPGKGTVVRIVLSIAQPRA